MELWSRVGECYMENMKDKTRIARTVSKAVTECPEPLDTASFTEVVSASSIPASVAVARSESYKLICRLRKFLRFAVLGFVFDEGVLWARITLQRLSPFYLGMQILEKVTFCKRALPTTGDFDQSALSTHVHAWRLTSNHTSHDFFQDASMLECVVCVQTECVGNRLVASYHDLEPLASVLRALERDSRKERVPRARDSDSNASSTQRPSKRKRLKKDSHQSNTPLQASSSAACAPSDLSGSDSEASMTTENDASDPVEQAWNA
eukprot:6456474-Amphidinium_carterae.1